MTGEIVYQWHPELIDDYRALPAHLRQAFLVAVEEIKRDPTIGEHLDHRASTGDLSAYRKLKFGDDTDRGPSHRIVYRLLPDNWNPAQFRVLAVRSREDVYATAARRARQPDR